MQQLSETMVELRTSARARAAAVARAELEVPVDVARRRRTGLSVSELLDRLEQSPRGRYAMRSLNVELSKAARAGEYARVTSFLEQIVCTNANLDLRAFTSVMHALIRQGDWQTAIRAFHLMRRTGIRPNQVAWNMLICAAATSRQHLLLAKSIREMEIAGLSPDRVTCGIIIHALVREKRWTEIEYHLKNRPLAVNTHAYTSLLAGYVRRGSVSDILRVEADMRERHVPFSIQTYTVLIRGLGNANEMEHVWRLYREVLECDQMGGPDSRIFESSAAALAKGGQVELAFRVFQDMRHHNVTATVLTHNSLIHACGQSRNVARAFIVYRFLVSPESNLRPNSATYIGLANALLRSSIIDERTKFVLDRLKSCGGTDPKVGAKIRALERIMNAECRDTTNGPWR